VKTQSNSNTLSKELRNLCSCNLGSFFIRKIGSLDFMMLKFTCNFFFFWQYLTCSVCAIGVASSSLHDCIFNPVIPIHHFEWLICYLLEFISFDHN
jgi:hypothetical protein